MSEHLCDGSEYGRIAVVVEREVEVDQEFGWLLTYTAGAAGMKPGGRIKIVFPAYVHQGSVEYVQVLDWWRPRFLYAYCADETVRLRTLVERIETAVPWVKGWEDSKRVAVIVAENGLDPGAEVHIRFGGLDRAYLRGQVPATRVGPLATRKSGTYLHFTVDVDVEGLGEFHSLEGFPRVKVVPGKPAYFTVTVPTVTRPQEEFPVHILTKDRYGNPVFGASTNDLTLIAKEATSGAIVATKSVTDADNCRFALDREGVYVIELHPDGGLPSEGAVTWCRSSGPRVFWGDIHNHSNLSPNIRDNDPGCSPEECYSYALEASFLDFMCLCEQTMRFDDDPKVNLDQAAWSKIGQYADMFYKPGRLVTFPGFELHSARGDTVVLFAGSLSEIPYPIGVEEIYDVWDAFSGQRFLTIPHFHPHSGGRPSMSEPFNEADWVRRNEQAERLAEVFSTQWGRLEQPGNPMLMKLRSNRDDNTLSAYLGRGMRWGITAASDDHDGRPGYGGITAVLAGDLTRDSIFDALHARRCYASTHPRMVLDFSVDGHSMGQEVAWRGGDATREVRCMGASAAGIRSIEIIRNGQVVRTFGAGDQALAEISFQDADPVNAPTYYYARVRQPDGHMAWSSPIWLIPPSHG